MKPTMIGPNPGSPLAPYVAIYPMTEHAESTILADITSAHDDATIFGTIAAIDDPTWGNTVHFDANDYAVASIAPTPIVHATLLLVSSVEPTNPTNSLMISLGNGGYVYTGIRSGTGGLTDCAVDDPTGFAATDPDYDPAPGTMRARAMVIDGDRLRYFIDGVLVSEKTIPIPTGVANQVGIGANIYGSSKSDSRMAMAAILAHSATDADIVAWSADPYAIMDGAPVDPDVVPPPPPPIPDGPDPYDVVAGSIVINESGHTIMFRLPVDSSYQPDHAPSIRIDGGGPIYLTHDGSADSYPRGRMITDQRRALWLIPTDDVPDPGYDPQPRVIMGDAVTFSMPFGAYRDASNNASLAVVDAPVVNNAGLSTFDGIPAPTAGFRLGFQTNPPYLYFADDHVFSNMMIQAGNNIRMGQLWIGPGVTVDSEGWPMTSGDGTASAIALASGRFVGGHVPVLWEGSGDVRVKSLQGGAEFAILDEDLTSTPKYRLYDVPRGSEINIVGTLPCRHWQVLYPGTINADRDGPVSIVNPYWSEKFRGRFTVIRSLGLQDPNNTNFPTFADRTPNVFALGEKHALHTASVIGYEHHPAPPTFFDWTNPHTTALIHTNGPHGFVTGQRVNISGSGFPDAGGIDGSSLMIFVESATAFSVGYYGSTDYAFVSGMASVDSVIQPGLSNFLMCEIANALGADLWYIRNHLMGDSDYAQMIAEIASFLDPNHRLVTEYSNEVWNNGFYQSQFAMAMSMQTGLAPGGNLMIGNHSWHGRKSAETAKIAKDTWGAAGRDPAQVVGTIAGQSGNVYTVRDAWTQVQADDMTQYVDRFDSAPYFGLQTANFPYWPADANRDIAAFMLGDPANPSMAPISAICDLIAIDIQTTVQSQLDDWASFSAETGVPIAAYEYNMHNIRGGNWESSSGSQPAYPAGTNAAVDDALIATNRHFRMGRFVIENTNRMATTGFRESCALASVGIFTPYPWAQYEYMDQLAGSGLVNVTEGLLFTEQGSEAVKAWAWQTYAAVMIDDSSTIAPEAIPTVEMVGDPIVNAPVAPIDGSIPSAEIVPSPTIDAGSTIDLGGGRMEPFDDSFYPDGIVVYRLITVVDAENIDNLTDGDPWPMIPCAIVDPRTARPMFGGVEPYGKESIIIYTPVDPHVTGTRQLIEIVRAMGNPVDPPKRLRTTGEDRIPINTAPYYVILADWENK